MSWDPDRKAVARLVAALKSAHRIAPCTNGEACMALMEYFDWREKQNPHFMTILLGAYGYEKRQDQADRPASVGERAGP